MAKQIENFKPKLGRTAHYPWEQWFDGSPWRLVHGEDYTCRTESMIDLIRKTHRRHLQAGTVTFRLSVYRDRCPDDALVLQPRESRRGTV